MHGHIEGEKYKTGDSGEEYTVGGLSRMGSVIKIIQEEAEGTAILVDSGDQFTGTLLSQYFNGTLTTKLLNTLNLNTTVLGNHEFDFPQQILQSRINQAQFKYVTSNILNKTNSFLFHNHTLPYQIIHHPQANIGVIGLTTYETYTSTAGNLSQILINQYYLNLTHYYAAFLKNQMNCSIIIVNAHLGTNLLEDNEKIKDELLHLEIRDSSSVKYKMQQNEFQEFVEALDNKLIDGVFAGHTHNIIHQFTSNGIPIIISGSYAKYLNVLYIDIDTQTNKLSKFIEGPIPICSKVFTNKQICDVDIMDNSVATNGILSKYSFHGKLVEIDQNIEDIIKPYKDIINKEFPSKVLSEVKVAMVRSWNRESSINYFIGDAFVEQCETDLSIFNPGMVRIDWPVGIVDYQLLFQTIPFNDQVLKVNLTGAILKRILFDVQSTNIYYPTKNIRITFQNNSIIDIKYYQDLNLVDIQDQYVYSLAIPDFLLYGGDDFSKVISYFHPNNSEIIQCGEAKDLLMKYLQKFNYINSKDNPIIDPKKPRLIIN